MAHALLNRNVLVLDAGYQPVNIVSARRAMVLICRGRAIPVEESEDVIHSPGAAWRLPRIIRLFIAIASRVYRAVRVQLNRKNVFARDHYTCQYCGSREGPFTIDHVVPRSRRTADHPEGGATSWENCVTCCAACNHRKGSHLLHEAGMHLLKKPTEPRWLPPIIFRRYLGNGADESWQTYLYL